MQIFCFHSNQILSIALGWKGAVFKMWLNKCGSKGWFRVLLLAFFFSGLNASLDTWEFFFLFFLKCSRHMYHPWSSKNRPHPLQRYCHNLWRPKLMLFHACVCTGILWTLLCFILLIVWGRRRTADLFNDLKGEAQLWLSQARHQRMYSLVSSVFGSCRLSCEWVYVSCLCVCMCVYARVRLERRCNPLQSETVPVWASEPALKLHTVYTDQETHASGSSPSHDWTFQGNQDLEIYPESLLSGENVFNFVQYVFFL